MVHLYPLLILFIRKIISLITVYLKTSNLFWGEGHYCCWLRVWFMSRTVQWITGVAEELSHSPPLVAFNYKGIGEPSLK
jgi:hypothetical protein